jgi:hypothetical protein
MEIEFEITKHDILALVRWRQEFSPAFQKRFKRLRFGSLVGFGLFGIGSLMITQEIFSLVFFLMFALVSYMVYPAFNDWVIRRNVNLVYQNETKRATLGKRILRASADGLEQISPFGEIKIKWAAIDNIHVSPLYAFISVGQTPSIVIPKDKVKESFNEFVHVCREYQETASV